MIQLRILGHPALESSNGVDPSVVLSHPQRLALLAYLALGTKGLIPRDKVLATFWAEQPEPRARHALNQGLHVLRRWLGPEVIVTRGESLGVDPTKLWCDVVALRDALRRGDGTRALELYQGPLLDGLFLSDASDFEHWLEATRAELHTQVAAAAARLAEAAAAAAQSDATALARRAAELAPHDEAAARRLIGMLDREGRPGAAIAAYDAFARRLLADCELHPSAELHALVAGIRARPAPQPDVTQSGEQAGVAAPVVSLAATPPRTRRRARAAVAIAAVAVVGVGLWSLGRGRELRAAPAEAATLGRVAVLPFEVQGDLTRSDSLGRNLVELLGSRLDGAGALRVVPADSVLQTAERPPGAGVALGFPVGSLIQGSVTGSAGTLHVRAVWRRSVDRSTIAEATAEGATAQLFGLLDRLTIQLLAQAQTGPRHALARSAALSTTSLPALKAYLAGEQAFNEGRFTAASQAFERATVADSGFAMAQYRLGVSALWAEDYPLAAVDAGSRALRHRAGLADRDRRLLTGFDSWRRGERDTALSNYLSILANDHDNLEGWFQLGETLFHYNPVWGQSISEARDAFRQTLRLDADHWGAHWHLAMLDALEGRTADLDHHLDHLLHLGPQTDYTLEIAVLRACAHRDGAALARLNDDLRASGEGRVFDNLWRCAVYGRDLEGAEAIARLLIERHTILFAEILGRYSLANLEMTRARRARALAQLDSLRPLSAGMALIARTNFALLPLVGAAPDELERLIQEWHKLTGERFEASTVSNLGRLQAQLGHTIAAQQAVAQLDTMSDAAESRGLLHALAQEVRAVAAEHEGNPAKALGELEEPPPRVWFGVMVSSPSASRGSGRFHRAEALAGTGRLQEALRWYGTLGELSSFDLIYAPLAHLRRAELYERLADTTGTAEEYARFLDLWKDADPELQPLVAQARERLTRFSAHR